MFTVDEQFLRLRLLVIMDWWVWCLSGRVMDLVRLCFFGFFLGGFWAEV